LEYSFPVDPSICLYRFIAKFDQVEIIGLVEEKEQAKKKYEEGLKEGKQVAYAEINEKSKDIRITIEFLQMLEVSLNTFWQLMLPSTISPRYINDKAAPLESYR
jgi:hypothetical protein